MRWWVTLSCDIVEIPQVYKDKIPQCCDMMCYKNKNNTVSFETIFICIRVVCAHVFKQYFIDYNNSNHRHGSCGIVYPVNKLLNYLIFGLLDLNESLQWHSYRCELKRSKVLTDHISRHKNCILYYFIWFSFIYFFFLCFYVSVFRDTWANNKNVGSFYLLKTQTKNQQLKLPL